MTRHHAVPAIPPFIDPWGRPTYENPYGHYRPNPQLTANALPTPTPTPEPPRPLPAPRAQAEAFAGARSERRTERPGARRTRTSGRARQAVAVLIAGGSSLVGISAASAYLSSTGSGSDSATAGTMQAVTASGAVVANLIPDGTNHNVTLTVTNPNSFAVTLERVIGNGTIVPDSPLHAACSPTGVTFTDQTGLSQSIPGGNVPTPVTLNGAAKMDSSSVDACQGATFTIPVTISVRKP